MGEPSPSSNTPENPEMFQTRDHTTLPGFSGHGSPSFSSASRWTSLFSSFKVRLLLVVAIFGLLFLTWATFRDTSIEDLPSWSASPHAPLSRYLSQPSYLKYSADSTHYRIAIISDMDTSSQIEKSLVFRAEVKEGRLIRQGRKYTLEWDLTVRHCYSFGRTLAVIFIISIY